MRNLFLVGLRTACKYLTKADNMTRGAKSSEKKACYHAFYAGMILAGGGLYLESDLVALAALIAAVASPLMFYAGARTAYKCKQGEEDVKINPITG